MNYISTSNPLAKVAVKKNELRVYDNGKIYLNDDTEFQIMLFNPTDSDILASISLNGKSIGNNSRGLILRPGERVWLERYFDESRKFKFKTYLADNSQEGKNAIKNNGKIKIEFFREAYLNSFFSGLTGNISRPSGIAVDPFWTSTGTYFPNFIGATATMNVDTPKKVELKSKKMLLFDAKVDFVETGKIQKGSNSDQSFEASEQSFEFWAFHTIEYQLLPISQKKYISSEDLKIRYCENCGKKTKNIKANFCSSCGHKL